MKKRRIVFLIFLTIAITSCVYAQNHRDFSFYNTNSDIINDICFSEKGEILTVSDKNSIKVFSTKSRDLICEFKNGHHDQIQAIDLSKDSTTLVSGGADSLIVIWDFINKQKIRTLTFQQSIITTVKFSPNGQYIVSGGMNNLYIYDIKEDKIIREISNQKIITDLAFSYNGNFFASSSADKSINIYETTSGELLSELTGHKSWVRSLTFSRDGNKLISCGDDSKIITWDISDLNNIKILTNSRESLSWILDVDLNEDNRTYAFGDFKGNIEIVGVYATYKTKLNSPIQKILFKPNEGASLKVIVATRGNGILFIDAINMKSKLN